MASSQSDTSSPGPSQADGLEASSTDSLQIIDSRPGGTKGKANVRVSLACVSCRSKHIKCDATLPVCLRCQGENKACFYAKSKRGIRDPKKRSMIAVPHVGVVAMQIPEQLSSLGRIPSLQHLPAQNMKELRAGWTVASRINASTPPQSVPAILVDLYFSHFYNVHPWTLPRDFLPDYLRGRPDDFGFLMSVLVYVGSIYTPLVPSEELREAAFTLACGPLPITPHTVQGLLCLSLAALGEAERNLSDGWMDRAIQVALELGMQHKAFADAEPDPILAEGHRRLYWSLYFQDCVRGCRNKQSSFSLYGVAATTELPCDEWEYQSGDIPAASSLADFDMRDPINDPPFSTYAYLIDLARSVGELVLPLINCPPESIPQAIELADARLLGWLLRVPKWKRDLVDANGSVDMVFFHAIGFAYTNRIRIRQPAARLEIPMGEAVSMAPLSAAHVAHKGKPSSWQLTVPDVQAACSFLNLFAFPLVATNISPCGITGLQKAGMALLDACFFLGCDGPLVREKLRLLLGVFTEVAAVWKAARQHANDYRDILVRYFPSVLADNTAAAQAQAAAHAVQQAQQAAAAHAAAGAAGPSSSASTHPCIPPPEGASQAQAQAQAELWESLFAAAGSEGPL